MTTKLHTYYNVSDIDVVFFYNYSGYTVLFDNPVLNTLFLYLFEDVEEEGIVPVLFQVIPVVNEVEIEILPAGWWNRPFCMHIT